MNESSLIIIAAIAGVLVAATLILLSRRSDARIRIRAAREVFKERLRQVHTEGFSASRDDQYMLGQLAAAASEYAAAASVGGPENDPACLYPRPEWPWIADWWKPDSRRKSLVKAGALIIAELERLDRLERRS